MTVCPHGHESVRGDSCDVCGAPLGGNRAADPGRRTVGKHRRPGPDGVGLLPDQPMGSFPATAPGASEAPESLFAPVSRPPDIPATPSVRPTTPMPAFTRATWTVLISPDRLYYDRIRASGALPQSVGSFPAPPLERRVPLVGKQVRIGRRSASRDFEPEIDLAEPPADRGVSRLHAILIAAPDGTWSLMDSGSANGTVLNGSEVTTGAMVPVREGDRINLGAWTAITVHRG